MGTGALQQSNKSQLSLNSTKGSGCWWAPHIQVCGVTDHMLQDHIIRILKNVAVFPYSYIQQISNQMAVTYLKDGD